MKKVLSVLCMALLAGGMIFTSCTKKQFTITVKANNDAWGTVTGGGTFDDGATTTLNATPQDGYIFVKWQDGKTDNPRTITVTADETYTAQFEAVTPGVKVTFKGSSWDAGDYAALFYSGTMQDGTPYSGWVVSAAKTADSQYPTCDVAMLSGKNTGTFTGTADGTNGGLPASSSFNYIEYYETGGITDGNYDYGDWWAKTATVNVTAFDATSLKMSANVDATMFDANEAFVNGSGVAAAPTAAMKDAITNVTLTTSSKSNVALKHGAKNMVAVK